MSKSRLILFAVCPALPVLSALLAGLLGLPAPWAAAGATLLTMVVMYPLMVINGRNLALDYSQRILNVIPYPVSIKGADSRLRVVNDAMAEYKRMSREALLGTEGHLDNENSELRRQRLEEDRMVLAGLPIWKEEHVADHAATGKELFQVIVKGRSTGLYGEPVIVTAQFDTTELNLVRREIEETLKREKSLHAGFTAYTQRLINAIPQPVYVKDAQSRYVIVNEAFCKLRMLSAEQLIGRAPNDLTQDDAKAALVIAEDREVLDNDIVISKEEHGLHPVTQEERYRWVGKRRCVDHTGQPVLVGATVDLTEWRRAEQATAAALEREIALRERVAAFTQRLIDVIPQPVYVKHADSRYMLVNRAMLDDMHREPDDLLGKNPVDLGANPDYASLVMKEDQRIAAGEVIYKEEHMSHPYSGKEVFRIISKRSCIDPEGRAVIVGTNFDITPLRQAERAAAAASEAKSVFLATMSHEIRTPLGGVIGMLRLALRQPIEDAVREQLNIGLRNAEALLVILNDVLDFSKIEAGELRLETIDFDLVETAQDVMQSFALNARERGVALALDLPASVGHFFRGDPTRLRQILVNLIGNALKFTRQGTVTVRFAAAQPGFACEVIDTGIGIPAEALPRMFQRFQQADSSTTRKYGGTGLGLAICKQLVEAMGGTISVHSSIGIGTTFRFVLPLPAGEARNTSGKTEALPIQMRCLNLLCAEDNATNQIIIRSLLEDLGHRVHFADNGLQALQQLAEQDFDAVMMDGRMPELDGLQTTRAIRAGSHGTLRIRNPRIPVIALTANVSDEDMAAFRAAGANHFLAKPVDDRQLTELMARLSASEEPAASPAIDSAAPAARPDMAQRLRSMLIRSLPGRIVAIDDALTCNDMTGLMHLFHGLKGNVSFGGDDTLAPRAAALEAAVMANDRDTVLREWPNLRAGLEALISRG
ncbi:ATP-binding protein [Viridibacterium curvum]|uniref:histidine kinase n=1 Tax=Viridibacterium curvum TaxID=1101404 RepID=A0ABP9Q622_9RHOO